MNAYKIIDENNWARATHCKIFRNYVEPAFCVTFEVNVKNFLAQIKKSIYLLRCRWFTLSVNAPMRLKISDTDF